MVFFIGVDIIKMKCGHGELDTHHSKHAAVYNSYIKSSLIRGNVSIAHLVLNNKHCLRNKKKISEPLIIMIFLPYIQILFYFFLISWHGS